MPDSPLHTVSDSYLTRYKNVVSKCQRCFYCLGASGENFVPVKEKKRKMTWPLKCDDITDDQEVVACINSPLAVYISCALIILIPGLTILLFPLAKKPAYLSTTNVLLAFGMSLSTGSLFYLLFPSCLEDKKQFESEHTLLRHVGSILCSAVWFFFIFDRLTKVQAFRITVFLRIFLAIFCEKNARRSEEGTQSFRLDSKI